jgi:hypothetical protein
LSIAQRCAAAVGDVSLSKYLGEIHEIKMRAEEEMGIHGFDHYQALKFKWILNISVYLFFLPYFFRFAVKWPFTEKI